MNDRIPTELDSYEITLSEISEEFKVSDKSFTDDEMSRINAVLRQLKIKKLLRGS